MNSIDTSAPGFFHIETDYIRKGAKHFESSFKLCAGKDIRVFTQPDEARKIALSLRGSNNILIRGQNYRFHPMQAKHFAALIENSADTLEKSQADRHKISEYNLAGLVVDRYASTTTCPDCRGFGYLGGDDIPCLKCDENGFIKDRTIEL